MRAWTLLSTLIAPRVGGLRVPVRPVCSAAGDTMSYNLFFERPLRRLFRLGRTFQLDLPRSERPLHALHAALRERLAHDDVDLEVRHGKRPIGTDGELAELFRASESRGIGAPQLRVVPCDEAGLPPVEDAAAEAAPSLSGPVQMVSFYRFHDHPTSEGRLPLLALSIRGVLAEEGVLGSVYVAAEGINAQIAVPLASVERVRARLAALDELAGLYFNLGERTELGGEAEGEGAEAALPFRKLYVRTRAQVLTDGLPQPLDWSRAGVDVPPEEWDEALREEGALLLDCRNGYESDVGSFARAEPLGTDVFSQSWEALRSRLDGVPRDAPIMTYCTGGIRCVKVNAWLEQEMGFTNTKKLKDGIVGYLRHLRGAPDAASSWRGRNFVFDKRTLVDSPREEGGGGAGEEGTGA